jgi:hypothetical protein
MRSPQRAASALPVSCKSTWPPRRRDLLRSMLTTFINTLISAEAAAICGAPYSRSCAEGQRWATAIDPADGEVRRAPLHHPARQVASFDHGRPGHRNQRREVTTNDTIPALSV